MHVIRRLRVPHCKRGPALCALCAVGDAFRICLLDVDPPDPDRVQRPTIEVACEGERTWRPYDVIRTFADEEDARRHAAEHGVTDVDLDA